MKTLWCTWTLAVGIACSILIGAHANDEHVLIMKIIRDYEKAWANWARPVNNVSDTLNVKFGLSLIEVNVDLQTQRLIASVWLRYSWNDVFLKWNPDQFNGIDHLRLPVDKLWKPDIVLYNGYGRAEVDTDALAVVSYDGTVLWIPQAIITVTCPSDGSHYLCPIKFGSWTYDGFKLDVNFYDNKEEIDVNDYIQSNIFQLTDHSAKKNVKYYPCCEEPYPDLTFNLGLEKVESGWFSG